MRSLLKAFIFVLALLPAAHAANGKFVASGGYFSLNAKAGSTSTAVSNPSAFHIAYLQPKWDKWELKLGYSVLMADFSGSDFAFGVDAGFNYYPFTDSGEETLQTDRIQASRYETWKPYVGMAFNQRSFQSARNSFAGFGISFGAEKYSTEKINFRGEVRYVSLGGSNESEATEMSLLFGVVFKL